MKEIQWIGIKLVTAYYCPHCGYIHNCSDKEDITCDFCSFYYSCDFREKAEKGVIFLQEEFCFSCFFFYVKKNLMHEKLEDFYAPAPVDVPRDSYLPVPL